MWPVAVRDIVCSHNTFPCFITVTVGVATIASVLLRRYGRELLKETSQWANVRLVLISCLMCVIYQMGRSTLACEVSLVKAAFLDGYQVPFKPPGCAVNRSDDIQMLADTIEQGPHYFLLEGLRGCGKTTTLLYAVNYFGAGAQYVSVTSFTDFDDSLASTVSLQYICMPDFWEHLANYLGFSTSVCANRPLERVRQILQVLDSAAWEMEGHHPILIIDNIGNLLNKDEGEDILYVLQDFAKEAADKRLLTMLFATSDGRVPDLLRKRSAASRLHSLYIEDISHEDAIEHLQCLLPTTSKEKLTEAVGLVGGRFTHLRKTYRVFKSGHGMDELRDQLYADVRSELERIFGFIVNLRGNVTNDLALVTMAIARAILESKDKQITLDELASIVQLYSNEQQQEDVKRLLSSNIFMERMHYTKFGSTLMQSYFEAIMESNEVETM